MRAVPRGTGSARRRCRVPAGRSEEVPQAQPRGHHERRRDIAVRHRPLGLEGRAGVHQGGAFQRGVDQGDDLPGQAGQVRQRLVPDPAVLAEGAPQQHALIAPFLTGLAHVPARDPGYVHRVGTAAHSSHDSGHDRGMAADRD